MTHLIFTVRPKVILSSPVYWWKNWGKGRSHNMSGMYLMKQGLNPDSGAKAPKHRAALPHSWAGSGPRTPSLLAACDKYSPARCQPLAHLPLLPVRFAALSANILPCVSTARPCLHSNRSLQHLKAFAGFCSANHLFRSGHLSLMFRSFQK